MRSTHTITISVDVEWDQTPGVPYPHRIYWQHTKSETASDTELAALGIIRPFDPAAFVAGLTDEQLMAVSAHIESLQWNAAWLPIAERGERAGWVCGGTEPYVWLHSSSDHLSDRTHFYPEADAEKCPPLPAGVER